MNDTRKQILAAFCGPDAGVYPARLDDFLRPVPRSIRLKPLAMWMTDPEAEGEEDLDAGKLFEMADHEDALEQEAQTMLKEGLLAQMKLNDLDHWQPPPGEYQLTRKGATSALAVLKEIRAGEKAT